MKNIWRTTEWLLAVAWPVIAYQEVFKRYGWKSDYYSAWGEIWFALVLLPAMAGPVVARFFSRNGVEAQKRVRVAALMVIAVAIGIKFRPSFGGLSIMGFFVPMVLHALAVFLWLGWKNGKSVPVKQEGQTEEEREAA